MLDYNKLHAHRAKDLLDLKGKKVLVVGANTGNDCAYFVEFGCSEVHGLDVIADIGSEFSSPRVFYHLMSVEEMSFQNYSFDLVYCFATMEHVQNINAAFVEMARVLKPGGILYSVAAPLWNSRVGHHKADLFSNYPWIHLRMTRAQIIQYCLDSHISAPGGIEAHVDYMLSDEFFNKRSASEYLGACKSLLEMNIMRNDLELEADSDDLHQALSELKSTGLDSTELRAVTHVYIGKKV